MCFAIVSCHENERARHYIHKVNVSCDQLRMYHVVFMSNAIKLLCRLQTSVTSIRNKRSSPSSSSPQSAGRPFLTHGEELFRLVLNTWFHPSRTNVSFLFFADSSNKNNAKKLYTKTIKQTHSKKYSICITPQGSLQKHPNTFIYKTFLEKIEGS